MREPKIMRKDSISVAFFVEELKKIDGIELETLTSSGAEDREIGEQIIHRTGLALAGFYGDFPNRRIQLWGNPECRYLAHLTDLLRNESIEQLCDSGIPCIFITHNIPISDTLIEIARAKQVPMYRTSMGTVKFMALVHDLLSDQFAQVCSVHGSLVEVYGIGLLLTGRSGIGKSEIALDLIERGHRLVADDVVILTKRDENVLMGSGSDWVAHFMEIRGLGLIDVPAMFGVRAIRRQKRVEVIVDLQEWVEGEVYERVGITDDMQNIMEVSLPLVRLPIIPGKNMTVICEVIAMNHLLKHNGYDPAKTFGERLKKRILEKEPHIRRRIEYFGHDFE